jgi:hydroxymethylbilane synthase
VLDDLVPAAGQGALALEARPGTLAPELLSRITDPVAASCVSAERELTRALAASCNTPVGAHARQVGDVLELRAWAGLPDGSEWVSDRLRAAADGIGRVVAERMLAAGAGELLRRAERVG